jgi:lipopolysaccharide transport system permease protein
MPAIALATFEGTQDIRLPMTDRHILIIEAGKTEHHYWEDLWRYRDLLFFLAWRDMLVRYKQAVLGVAWAVLRPALTMAIFTIVFGRLAKLPSANVPYPVLVFAALLPWQLFASSLSDSGNSLISNANMISKVYFPRLMLPLSALATNLVDFAISFGLLAVTMTWYGFFPDWRIVFLPFFMVLALAAALGAGLWSAALVVRYRDFRFVVPFLIQIGLYISPVGFSSSIVPEQWRLLYSLNPMVGVIEGFRWCLAATPDAIYWPGLAISMLLVLALMISGVLYFRATEKTFSDVI